MKWHQILYLIREGFRSIFSHGLMSFAAVCMIVACLLIMGSFALLSVNIYAIIEDLEQQNQITEKDMEISFLRGRDAAKNDTLETYGFINSELKQIREKIAAQDVKNAQIEGTFAVLGEQIGSLKNEFMAALCRERDERVCGDNTIINYANATFYAKLVAGVTPTTETTAQTVYNPLPNCGCR